MNTHTEQEYSPLDVLELLVDRIMRVRDYVTLKDLQGELDEENQQKLAELDEALRKARELLPAEMPW